MWPPLGITLHGPIIQLPPVVISVGDNYTMHVDGFPGFGGLPPASPLIICSANTSVKQDKNHFPFLYRGRQVKLAIHRMAGKIVEPEPEARDS